LAMSLYFVRASCWRFLRMVISVGSIFCLPMLLFCSIFWRIKDLLADYFDVVGFIFRLAGSVLCL
jgi:hypothetical protein